METGPHRRSKKAVRIQEQEQMPQDYPSQTRFCPKEPSPEGYAVIAVYHAQIESLLA